MKKLIFLLLLALPATAQAQQVPVAPSSAPVDTAALQTFRPAALSPSLLRRESAEDQYRRPRRGPNGPVPVACMVVAIVAIVWLVVQAAK